MSNTDFQKRLQRIPEDPKSWLSADPDFSGDVRVKANRVLMAIGGGLIGLGVHLARKANENYDFFRESGQPEQLFGLVAAAVVAFLIGTGLILRGAKPRPERIQTQPRANSAKKRFFSTMGLVIGFLVGFCISYFFQLYSISKATGLEKDLSALEGLIFTTIAMLLVCLVWSAIGGIWTFFRFLSYTVVGFVLSLVMLGLWVVNPYHVVSFFGFTH